MELALTMAGSLRPLLELTRPRVVAMVVFTALPVLLWGPLPTVGDALAALAGTLLVAAGNSALNAWVERDRDARMARTRSRPLPSGRLPAGTALGWALAITGAGLAILPPAAAAIALATTVIYVGAYTAWLKPRSAHNTVVGAVAGAAAPLIVDAALRGSPGVAGWVCFAVVFAWQMPHTWAIALYRAEEYAAAGIVMMPAVVGPAATRRRMLAWAIALLGVSL
ncbi:MAG: protoheme IX farnesyltransferase, partial [Myxococcota bacterium]